MREDEHEIRTIAAMSRPSLRSGTARTDRKPAARISRWSDSYREKESIISGDKCSIRTGRLFSTTIRNQYGGFCSKGTRMNKSQSEANEESRLRTFNRAALPPS